MNEANSIRVLFITHYSGLYGANRSMLQLIKELMDEPYNIKPLVLLPSEGELCDELTNNGIPFFIKHYYWWVNENKGIFQWLLNWRKQLINRIKLPQKSEMGFFNFDLVYSNSFTINIGSLLARKYKKPHVWHIRESLEAYHFKLSTGKYFTKRFLKNSDSEFIMISRFINSRFDDLIPSQRINIVYNGINIKGFKQRINENTGTLKLCMTGIISEQKNNLDAVKALKIITDRNAEYKIELHLIGAEKEEYSGTLKKIINESGLRNKVIFHGHCNNVSELLQTMNIGLMCSRDEGFGRSTIEYMLNTMPVIVSRSGANPEIIDEKSGFIYELYNEQELAQYIQLFIDDPLLLQLMGNNGFNYARDHFSSQINANKIYNIFTNLLSK